MAAPVAAAAGKSKLVPIIIIAVVAVVVIAAAFMFMGGGQGTPDAAATTFANKMIGNDLQGALDTTILKFADQTTKDNWIANSAMPEGMTASLNSVTTTASADLSTEKRDSGNSFKTHFEEEYSQTVEDIAWTTIKFDWSHPEEGSGTDTMETWMFKIGGQWYLAPDMEH